MGILQLLEHVNPDALEASFDQIARALFQNCYIRIHQSDYQLTEIEFYYYHPQKHPDIYVHKNAVQLKLGNWYFHGSGLDITFGQKAKGIYGGILLRGIKNLSTGQYCSGPINTLRELMRNFQLITAAHQMQLVEAQIAKQKDIIKAPRIGLNPKRDQEANSNYWSRPYRYLIDWEPEISGHSFKNKLKVREQGILCTFV